MGISLVGLVTATVTSWFLAQGQRTEAETEELAARLARVARVARVKAKLDQLLEERGGGSGAR